MAVPAAAAGAGATALGVASVLSPLLGSAVNYFSQQETNRTNLRATRETNALNKELFERNLAWQEDMWNKSNEYNDPSKQVERLLKAGINPAFVLGNGSMAQASPMSAPSAPSMQAPHLEAPQIDPNAVSNGINAFFNSRVQQAQVKALDTQSGKTEAETAKLSQELPYYIQHLQNLAKGEGWKADIARTELTYLQAVQGQRISREFGNNRLLERQIKQADEQYISYQLQNQLARVQLAYAPKLNDAQLSQYYTAVNEMKANIALTLARKDLTNEEKLKVIEEKNGIIIDNQMKDIDKSIKEETKQVSIDVAKEGLYSLQDARFERPYNFYREHLGEGRRLGTPGIAGAVDLYQYNDSKRGYSVYRDKYADKYSGRVRGR